MDEGETVTVVYDMGAAMLEEGHGNCSFKNANKIIDSKC